MDSNELLKNAIVLGACGLVGYAIYQAITGPSVDGFEYDYEPAYEGGYGGYDDDFAGYVPELGDDEIREFDGLDYDDADELIDDMEAGGGSPWRGHARRFGEAAYGGAKKYAPVVGRGLWAGTKAVGRGAYRGGRWAYGRAAEVDWAKHAKRAGEGAMGLARAVDSLTYMEPTRAYPHSRFAASGDGPRNTVIMAPAPEAMGWVKGQTMAMNRRRRRRSRRRSR